MDKAISTVLDVFIEASNRHAIATEQGDYKIANKCYKEIIKSIDLLRKSQQLDQLHHLLVNTSVGVRMWSATFLLPIYEKDSIHTLEQIVTYNNIHSHTAKTTISEWEKGNLRVY